MQTEHISIIQALFSTLEALLKDYCVITWAQHAMAWLQFVRLSSFLSVGHSHEELCWEENIFNI